MLFIIQKEVKDLHKNYLSDTNEWARESKVFNQIQLNGKKEWVREREKKIMKLSMSIHPTTWDAKFICLSSPSPFELSNLNVKSFKLSIYLQEFNYRASICAFTYILLALVHVSRSIINWLRVWNEREREQMLNQSKAVYVCMCAAHRWWQEKINLDCVWYNVSKFLNVYQFHSHFISLLQIIIHNWYLNFSLLFSITN